MSTRALDPKDEGGREASQLAGGLRRISADGGQAGLSRRRFPEISHQKTPEQPLALGKPGGEAEGHAVAPRTVLAVQGREFTEIPPEEAKLSEVCGEIRNFLCDYSWHDLPITQWLPKYSCSYLKFDLIAGISVGVLLIPQSLAYALLAGMPAISGMYSSIVPLIVYSLLASSSKVNLGPVAPTSILINGIIQSVAPSETDPDRLIMLGSAIAFCCGVIQVVMGLLRFGFIAKLLSWPVMTGYLTGAAITIIASQLKDLLGLKYPSDVEDRLFYQRVYNAAAYITTTSWPTALISLGCLLVLVGFKYLPQMGLWPCCGIRSCGSKPPQWFPIQLLVVIASIGLSLGLGVTGSNSPYFSIVGVIPPGLPSPIVPLTSFDLFVSLLPQAFVLALIAYVGTVSLAVSFARKDNEHVSANTELMASGLACLAGSFFQSFTVAGSFTRSAVNADIGAKTPVSGLVTAGLMILALAFIAPIFEVLPKATLAAMIIAATLSLIKFGEMYWFWKRNRVDGLQAYLTLVLTLVIGVDWGIIASAAIALAILVLRSFKPRLTEIGWLPGTDVFVDRARYPQAVLIPGVILYRIDGEIHYGNIDTVSGLLQKTLDMAVVTGAAGPTAREVPAPPPAAIELTQPTNATVTSKSDSSSMGELPDHSHEGSEHSDHESNAPIRGTSPTSSGRDSYLRDTMQELSTLPIDTRAAEPLGDDDSDDDEETTAAVAGATEAERTAQRVRKSEALVQAAAERLREERMAMLSTETLRAVIVDCSRVSGIDLTACRELKDQVDAYSKQHVLLMLAALPGPVRDVVERFGVMESATELTSPRNRKKRFISVAGAVESVVDRSIWPSTDEAAASGREPLAIKLSRLRASSAVKMTVASNPAA